MIDFNEHKFEDRETLLAQLCDDIIGGLSTGISQRGKASALLSGGSSPRPLYKKMSERQLDWQKVYFAPTDERWVEPTHQDSNERLIRETLIQNEAIQANYISLKSDAEDPLLGQAILEKNIAKLPLPMDVVLLGMGEDGHVASLFPGLADTAQAIDMKNKKMCHAINRGADEVQRMTMTLSCLMNAKRIFLLFYGKKKLDVFTTATQQKTDQLPVSYLLHQNKVPISLYWAE